MAVGILASAGCMYSLTGGGLPSHIRTVSVLPFENETPQPGINSDLQIELQEELPRNLGVRLASEEVADAVVRGKILSYEETAPTVRPSTEGEDLNVVQRQIRIGYEAEIYDVEQDRLLWRGGGLSAVGNYQPDQELSTTARTRAIEEMVRRIIEGAQSQW